ncbi:MAG TPA: enoyl-CoA hydratase-related protein [candidate division Zixibacteria bacterium]|nr:enoyl-CoA hydratase/isomerase family protein [candidate division Zixibacteria bacterium]MDD4918816.1 enoyl-CoA hydratase-related protein [candidate division Zixibacteria bacterium]MDM7973621.1 enoyl-CoA hydratase-related protein [candidate division Zixibacteria bacterium]HOD66489.1 enoyl-CoA hydratase-related protein [candidate division Zixibacteria bacterium]HOZ08760.1 enoyl-CoA hydratase-related protein [candidate division Zixibacteria bacterium]
MTEYKNIIVRKDAGCLWVTINRERALNALNRETIDELQQLFSFYWTDDEVRVVVVTGTGEKAFVAGADITELAETDLRTGTDYSARGLYLMKTIQNFPRPVIAMVNGFALGGGCELAMACDIRIASDKAKFGQPEVNLGIIPGFGGTQRLPRLVGRGTALKMILTGEMIAADEAKRIGLVQEVVPAAELTARVQAIVELICAKAPMAIAAAKECVNRGLDVSMSVGCDLEKVSFGQMCATGDKNEGCEAFLEKRKPMFTGH